MAAVRLRCRQAIRRARATGIEPASEAVNLPGTALASVATGVGVSMEWELSHGRGGSEASEA